MVGISAWAYSGAAGVAGFSIRTLSADTYDMLSAISDRLFSVGLGVAAPPTRSGLICEEIGQASEADNAAAESQIRRQVVRDKSGPAYNRMALAMRDGASQPIFILSRSEQGGAKFCAAVSYRDQDYTSGGRYRAVERSGFVSRALAKLVARGLFDFVVLGTRAVTSFAYSLNAESLDD
jgi:hypothetical protein